MVCATHEMNFHIPDKLVEWVEDPEEPIPPKIDHYANDSRNAMKQIPIQERPKT